MFEGIPTVPPAQVPSPSTLQPPHSPPGRHKSPTDMRKRVDGIMHMHEPDRGPFVPGRPIKTHGSPTKRDKKVSDTVQFELESLDDIQRVESVFSMSRKAPRGTNVEDLVQTCSLSQFPIVESFISPSTGDRDAEGTGSPHRRRLAPAVPSFHAHVLIDVFSWIEERWTTWGSRPISFHDFVTSEQQHNLVRLPPRVVTSKCNACGQNLGVFACPVKENHLDCPERQYACQTCYSQGFTFHVGLLEGEHREYKLTVLKQLFEEADSAKCGALDFLEYMFFTVNVVYVRQNWGEYRPDKSMKSIWEEMTKVKEMYSRWADSDKGMELATLQRLLEELDFPTPPSLVAIFSQRADADGHLSFRGFVELMYTILRPQSEFVQTHPKVRLPRPQLSARPRSQSLCPPDMDSFDHRLAKQHKLLGEGGSSFAWLIHFANFQMCAKCPKPNISKREISDMMEAARLQRLVHHENVLRVLGIYNNSSWPCILLELAQGGDISMWQVYDVDRALQLRALREVAKGINALHTNTPTIIHRDIKGRNVLLTSDLVAKVADFDYAVVVRNPTAKTSGICGTPGYMAPEVVMDKEYWTAVDVFSFGSLMYEVTHKRHPFSLEVSQHVDEIRRPTDFAHRCAQLVKEGARPALDPHCCPAKMRALIRDCWAQDPHQRPTMLKVIDRLATMDYEFSDHYRLPDANDGEGARFSLLRRLWPIAHAVGLSRLTRVDLFVLSIIVLVLAVAVTRFT
eukprot:GGOE01024807.1.p1 GENE.GGOE01024807.1~~GGOE01024807.1.p1  ORF type:complete len:739 (+),score=183.86 GGOE01024807.1:38-2254(+)